MIENYLQILEESLHKKIEILKKITAENKNQEKVLKEKPISFAQFEESVDRKSVLIEELNCLDGGFEQLYDRIKEQLLHGKEQYQKQIALLQGLIARVTEESVSIQAQEIRNKASVDRFFADSRKNIQEERVRSRQSLNYYNRLNGGEVSPQFLDTKQ